MEIFICGDDARGAVESNWIDHQEDRYRDKDRFRCKIQNSKTIILNVCGTFAVGGINSNFSWNYLSVAGTAGGILVGFRNSKFDIISWEINCFSISTIVKNTTDHVIWKLFTVYGSTYDHGKQEFINELRTVLSGWVGPMIIGGDFNLIMEAAIRTMGILIFIGLTFLTIGLIIGG